MKTLLKYLKPFYSKMTLGFGIKVLGTVIELFIPYILSHILANVKNFTMNEIVLWGSLMIVCALFSCVFNIIANRMAAKVSKNFAESMRKDLFIKTLRLSAAQTDKFTIPSLESRITTDTYHVHGFVNMMQRMGVRAPILLAGGILITMIMDFRLSLVMTAILPLIFATVYFVRKKGVPLYENVQKAVDSMIRVVREDSQGIRVIKALSKTDYEHRRYDNVNRSLSRSEAKAGIIMGSVHPLMTIFMNGGSVAVISLGAIFAFKGKSEPETIIAFMQYFTQITMAMMAVTRMFVMYTKCSASARRISEVLNAPEEIKTQNEKDFPAIKTDAHIVFDKVCFSYAGKKNNIDNISFSLKKGESLGVIGATGSGKSTLIKLLLRFYDVNSGNIYINGKDIRTIDKKDFYSMFGSAMQKDFLYAGTIEENIDFGRKIPFDKIKTAAKIAQADDFIEGFADGYGHILSSHGTNISGGQKQRLLISRAIAGNPDILILDDSSSALDYKTDAALRGALKETLLGTTLISVAQRVSSVKDCTLIIVLEDGCVIGMGTHEFLMENCPEYKEISDSQMGGAFVE
ncbi:MAG: ABC transporter ATP-binding protein [Clostridia bacterium]|nr:ABC transporter ATP-binding protein [Clostridia bacterium]MBO7288748.1 ABC transporter ATP-binding protein [Clostridia bacterium]